MQFLVLAYDHKDEEAIDRRLAVRAEHVKLGDQLKAEGSRLYLKFV